MKRIILIAIIAVMCIGSSNLYAIDFGGFGKALKKAKSIKKEVENLRKKTKEPDNNINTKTETNNNADNNNTNANIKTTANTNPVNDNKNSATSNSPNTSQDLPAKEQKKSSPQETDNKSLNTNGKGNVIDITIPEEFKKDSRFVEFAEACSMLNNMFQSGKALSSKQKMKINSLMCSGLHEIYIGKKNPLYFVKTDEEKDKLRDRREKEFTPIDRLKELMEYINAIKSKKKFNFFNPPKNFQLLHLYLKLIASLERANYDYSWIGRGGCTAVALKKTYDKNIVKLTEQLKTGIANDSVLQLMSGKLKMMLLEGFSSESELMKSYTKAFDERDKKIKSYGFPPKFPMGIDIKDAYETFQYLSVVLMFDSHISYWLQEKDKKTSFPVIWLSRNHSDYGITKSIKKMKYYFIEDNKKQMVLCRIETERLPLKEDLYKHFMSSVQKKFKPSDTSIMSRIVDYMNIKKKVADSAVPKELAQKYNAVWKIGYSKRLQLYLGKVANAYKMHGNGWALLESVEIPKVEEKDGGILVYAKIDGKLKQWAKFTPAGFTPDNKVNALKMYNLTNRQESIIEYVSPIEMGKEVVSALGYVGYDNLLCLDDENGNPNLILVKKNIYDPLYYITTVKYSKDFLTLVDNAKKRKEAAERAKREEEKKNLDVGL